MSDSPLPTAQEPNFNAAAEDNAVSEDQLKQGDTKDISQDNIINERTRGAQQSAYKQENDVDAAVDAAINADEGQKS